MFQTKKSYTVEKQSVSAKSTEDNLHCSNTIDQTNPTNEANTSKHVKPNPFLGLFYAFISSTTFTLGSVIVKKLSYINPAQLTLVRNSGVLAGSIPVAIYCVKEVLGAKQDRVILLIRGFLGAIALYLNLTAFSYLPLAEATVVMSAMPAVTTLIARVYLKEPCGLMQILSLVITICGVIATIRLPELLTERGATRYDYFYVGGLIAAVGCAVTVSFIFVVLRKMKHIHFSVTMLYVGLLGMMGNAAINSATSVFTAPACGWDQIMCILMVVLGFLSDYAFTLSLRVETAGIMSIFITSLDIISAIVFQIIFFDENLDIYNITGTVLVLASLSIIGIRNWLQALPEESKTRLKLRYFLL